MAIYSFTSDKCDFTLIANAAANSFTIMGDVRDRIHINTQIPDVVIAIDRVPASLASDKCDWFVSTQAIRPLLAMTVGSAKCDWGSDKCDWGGDKCDLWRLTADSPNMMLRVDHDKCDWRVTAASNVLNLKSDNNAGAGTGTNPNKTQTVLAFAPKTVIVDSLNNNVQVTEIPNPPTP